MMQPKTTWDDDMAMVIQEPRQATGPDDDVSIPSPIMDTQQVLWIQAVTLTALANRFINSTRLMTPLTRPRDDWSQEQLLKAMRDARDSIEYCYERMVNDAIERGRAFDNAKSRAIELARGSLDLHAYGKAGLMVSRRGEASSAIAQLVYDAVAAIYEYTQNEWEFIPYEEEIPF